MYVVLHICLIPVHPKLAQKALLFPSWGCTEVPLESGLPLVLSLCLTSCFWMCCVRRNWFFSRTTGLLKSVFLLPARTVCFIPREHFQDHATFVATPEQLIHTREIRWRLNPTVLQLSGKAESKQVVAKVKGVTAGMNLDLLDFRLELMLHKLCPFSQG